MVGLVGKEARGRGRGREGGGGKDGGGGFLGLKVRLRAPRPKNNARAATQKKMNVTYRRGMAVRGEVRERGGMRGKGREREG